MSKFFEMNGVAGVVENGLFGEVLVDDSGKVVGEIVETSFGKEVVAADGTPLGVAKADSDGNYRVW